ncbi:MAG: thiamine-phosphate kinase [Pseudomonadota bacterium]|nr:thiamine-phosphate kinase [Pseudomonadota bacterium]
MDEFDLIARYFRPLAKNFPGSLNLTDDAAVMAVPAGHELVVTKDAISQGVHFIGDEDPALIARKLLRVNLSDMAAMGAVPLCYFLALLLPSFVDEGWIKRFTEGLREDQATFGIDLAGGDTSATQGTLSLSATVLGVVPTDKALRRSGARAGDDIYVSGTLGDSALGLALLQNKLDSCLRGNDELKHRYFIPQPRLALGQKLIGIASACMDISDGLVQDLGHICEASSVGAVIHRETLPLSQAAAQCIWHDEKLWDAVLGGGDDYELLFTAAPEKHGAIGRLASELSLSLTKIGNMGDKRGVQVLDGQGHPLKIKYGGFRHFS